MKNKIKITFISISSLIVFSVLIGIKLYNKPHVDVGNSEADFLMTASILMTEYSSDELQADKKYANKILQVTGNIYSISIDEVSPTVSIKDTVSGSGIICAFKPHENSKLLKLKKNQLITIKGICSGYLLDVMMLDCIIIK